MTDVLDELFAVIEDRKVHPPPGSYTARLLDGGDEVLKKVGEEAMEVLLASRDLTLDDVRCELARRRH